jgi:hypothetical protein
MQVRSGIGAGGAGGAQGEEEQQQAAHEQRSCGA